MTARPTLVGIAAVAIAVGGVAASSARVGPPRYRACGRVWIGFRTPVYAHDVSCAIGTLVVRRCSARNGTCFGQLALPYDGSGEPTLPQPPSFKPLGFECWQVWGRYTAGLPPPPRNLVADPKLVLCARDASRTVANQPVIYQQLVAYVL